MKATTNLNQALANSSRRLLEIRTCGAMPDTWVLSIKHPFDAIFIRCLVPGRECKAAFRVVYALVRAENRLWNQR